VHLAELAAAAGLLLVAVLALGLALDGLAVRHVRLREHDVHAEPLLHALHRISRCRSPMPCTMDSLVLSSKCRDSVGSSS
jgi:hypothetical protein